jgi:3-oxoacyl-[acyl-carrier protein] reductase
MAPDSMQFASFEQVRVGDQTRLRRTFTADAVDAFAQVSGDDNPLHVDAAFAAKTRFGKRVAHGMLSAAYLSRIVGTQLPGAGALWFQQAFDFLVPILVGDDIEFTVTVEHKSEATRTIVISVAGVNQHGTLVLKGQGRVMVLEDTTTKPVATDGSRVALVTGASRGIGAAIAIALANAGHRVIVNYHRSDTRAREVAEAIQRGGGQAMTFAADVTDAAAVARMVADAEARLGAPVEILVNNASGATAQKALLDQSWEELSAHFDMQVRAAFNCLKVVAPGMAARGSGHIVNIGSTHAWNVPPPNLSGYVAAKAALAALTRSAAVELGPKGVRVNCISPGMTETELIADVPERMRKVLALQTPLRRLALPDDVAAAVVMLVSKAGSFIHGADIPVSGGGVM